MRAVTERAVVTPQDVCVVGAGYVGLTAAACLAELGHRVRCLEVNRERLALLQAGRTPIVEPGLDEIVARGLRSGRLRFTDAAATALGEAHIALLCVGTPPRAAGTPDLRQIAVAAQQITAAARQRSRARQRGLGHSATVGCPDLILAVKSTVPPGSCEALEVLCTAGFDGDHGGVQRRNGPARPRFGVEVVSNPEFLREGRAVEDFFHPDRLVVGAADPQVGRMVADLYPSGAAVVLCDRRSAELVKYAANTFLAVKISFANEVAGLCERLGADVDLVLRGVGLDDRIGRAFLGAGPGFGGSCLPKDLAGFIGVGASLALRTPLARAALTVNDTVCAELVDKLDLVLGGLDGARVGVLGLAFKPGTDDIRDSPAIRLIGALVARGARVRACDPLATAGADLPAEVVGDPLALARDADALVVATAWPEFAELDPGAIRAATRGAVLLDAVGLLPEAAWRAAGFRVYGIGRGTPTSFHPVIWPPLTWAMAEDAESLVGVA
ncbi:MAG: UDP-glucose/GDP-mannose dehydrogenase family protein [Candidatus Dormibacteraeota bacterium]|uniref:UDP-glucose 6-dehydrogenase n=1 Tax=Candidatus Aeolococcus gillhamiae TaxID=3127015 RepID=A0A934JUU3_9BACT|nr:UDP-glucose/GDP-mannose dehydrogenase family protein [Candidatus Dormibacteraeota bacterium]